MPGITGTHSSSKIARGTIALLGAAALCWWAVLQWQQAADRRQFRQDTATLSQRVFLQDVRPATVQNLLRVAETRENQRIPPDYDGAAQLVETAITKEPGNSSLWLRLARLRLLQGRTEQAQAALEYSDQLDPHFPRQRLDSITLWLLLGNEARAEATARRLAQLGDDLLVDVATQLRSAGYAPARIMNMLNPDPTKPALLIRVLEKIRTGNQKAMEDLLATIPDPALTDPEFRRRVATMAYNPAKADFLHRLWKQSLPAGEELEEVLPGLHFWNRTLHKAPFEEEFTLGWCPFPASSSNTLRWQADQESRSGEIQWEIGESPSTAKKSARWLFHRIPWRAGVAATISIRAQSQPEGSATLRIEANTPSGKTPITGTITPPDETGWVQLTVDIPAAPQDRVMELHLIREPRSTASNWQTPTVRVSELRVNLLILVSLPTE